MIVEVSGCILFFIIFIVPLGMILWGVFLQSRETTGQALAIEAELKGPVPVVDTPEGHLWQMVAKGNCPDCRSQKGFRKGPYGGLSTNIQCMTCKHWFKVTPALGVGFRLDNKE